MGNLCLSKSKYCRCIQCKKIFWLDQHKKEVSKPSEKDAIYENGNKVGELARGLFGKYENIPHNDDLSIMVEKKSLIKEILEWGYCFVVALVIAMLFRYFVGTLTTE